MRKIASITQHILSIALVLQLVNLGNASAQCDGQAIFTDSRDGKGYSMIQIDGSTTPYCLGSSQCWMQENLDHGTRINGTINQVDNGIVERYCYNDDINNCNAFGGLYQWNEMMQYGLSDNSNGPGPQGICPIGWHIPTQNEWRCLEMNLGMTQAQADMMGNRGTNEGDQLKNTSWDGTNTSGFSALPGGHRNTTGTFHNINTTAFFWSATENSATQVWRWILDTSEPRSNRGTSNESNAFSVRCVRDNAPIPLPVELLYFKADWLDNRYDIAELTWETQSEVNNSHFEIERSIDAINFEFVKSVQGAGNSLEKTSYTTLDEEPYHEGTSYYRLKQVDNNGDYKYSNIEALNVLEGLSIVNVYPNPTVNELNILLTSSLPLDIKVTIKNNLGQELRLINQRVETGLNSLNLQASELSSGNYFVEVSTTDGLYKFERKFLKIDQ